MMVEYRGAAVAIPGTWVAAARTIPAWVLLDIVRALPPSPTSLSPPPRWWLAEVDRRWWP